MASRSVAMEHCHCKPALFVNHSPIARSEVGLPAVTLAEAGDSSFEVLALARQLLDEPVDGGPVGRGIRCDGVVVIAPFDDHELLRRGDVLE